MAPLAGIEPAPTLHAHSRVAQRSGGCQRASLPSLTDGTFTHLGWGCRSVPPQLTTRDQVLTLSCALPFKLQGRSYY